jgi:hypothetical protein
VDSAMRRIHRSDLIDIGQVFLITMFGNRPL